MEKPSVFERLNNWAKGSVTLKLIAIGFLILILLIPSSMMTSLIREREEIRDDATNEVSSKWGGSQTIGGPILSIPYKARLKAENDKVETVIRYAHFLPDQLNIKGHIVPEKRYRGIYVVVLYNTQLQVNGKFSYPDLGKLNVAPSDFLLEDAFVSLGISDMKGIKQAISFRMNDSLYSFNPGIPTNDIFGAGLSFPVSLSQKSDYTFDFNLNLNGSQNLSFLPLGKETNVALQAPWNNPSFEGTFLPTSRTITAEGFNAQWKVLHLNRNYPQQGLGQFIGNTERGRAYEDDRVVEEIPQHSSSAAFGVRLRLPLDEYQKTMRSAKYKEMFIFLTFLAFFFVEVLNRKRIHPIQYLLIGFAICLFYILLLSLSEHISFDLSYLIGCMAILSLVSFYAWSIFKSKFLTGLIGGILVVLYGFFYSLLQLQDYALLMGSLGLLLILAAIMALTRNIDWYNIQTQPEKE
jgi:inner membrane protein